MAVVTAAAIGAVGALGAGYMAKEGAEDAAAAGERAGQAGIAEQRAARQQFQENIQPYMQFGTGAISGLEALNEGDYSGFEESPDYLYARQQMQQGLERGAASRGRLYSGGTNVDLARHLGGLASQNLGAYRSNLMQQAAMGQNAAVGAGTAGMQSASNIGNLYGNIGQAQAGGAINQANAIGGTLQNLAGIGAQYASSRSSAYTPQSMQVTRQPINMPNMNVRVPDIDTGI